MIFSIKKDRRPPLLNPLPPGEESLLYNSVMRILGIDPGLATIGLGLIETKDMYNLTVLEWLTITTDSHTPFPERLKEISKDLCTFIDEMKPDLAVIEQLFFATNEQTALAVAHARGVIMLTVAQRNIPIIEPTPLQLKSGLTGDGKADKRQIQDMLCHMLHLKEIPRPDDAADALALAVFGALQNKIQNPKHENRNKPAICKILKNI